MVYGLRRSFSSVAERDVGEYVLPLEDAHSAAEPTAQVLSNSEGRLNSEHSKLGRDPARS
jgi:hypothetical protein